MEKVTKNPAPIFDHQRLQQNRKILRYRACLAQLAVICVSIKRLNPEYLSYDFCQFFKDHVQSLTNIRKSIQEEIQRQSELGWISKEIRPRNFYGSSHLFSSPNATPARARIFIAIRFFCDILLSELHVLNYEHLSDASYTTCGEIMDFSTLFRCEITKEKELQSQARIGKVLRKAS